MIGSIRGTVLRADGMTALIEAGGVGYEVEVSGQVLPLLQKDQEIFLYIHHAVREDAEVLYGFSDYNERSLFRELIRISGIGPRIALSVVSTIKAEDFARAIASGSTKEIVAVPGIGKKTAERLIVEMKDRLQLLSFIGEEAAAVTNKTADECSLYKDEAAAALMGLGYKEAVALKLVESAYQEGMDTKAIIVAALAIISKTKR